MNTPNNAAALERIAKIAANMKNLGALGVPVKPECVVRWADELATLRATLAQPDALTSQPSGGGELPFAFYNADANRFFWFDETIGAPVKLSGVVNLYIHPSADAPGVAVDEVKTGTVADYSDENLLRRVVRHVARKARHQPAWARISQAFCLGSTYSAQLCRRFGIDPKTGKDTAALAPKPEGGHG